MGIKKITLWVVSAVLLSSISLSTFAADPGFYMGIQLGAGDLHNSEALINTGQKQNPLSPIGCTSSNLANCHIVATTPTNVGVAERIYMGSNINRYFGFEIGAANYTPSEYSPNVEGYSHQPHIWEYSADILGKVMLPLGRFGIFGKGGIAFVYKSASSAILENDDSNSSFFFVPAYGAGISFSLSPRWEVDLSAMRIQGTDDLENIDFYALGISYHLVDEYCGQFLC